MKYLKYALGILVILVVGFFLLGFIKSDITYECDIMVDKSLSESWAVSQDQEKMADWLDGFQKIQHVSGSPGAVGAVSDIYFMNEGEEMTIRETITDIVPNESVSMLFTSDFMDMDYKMTMQSINGKTKIVSSTTCRGNGMVSKSLVAMMGSAMKTQEETNLASLKKTIEENSKNYFSIEN